MQIYRNIIPVTVLSILNLYCYLREIQYRLFLLLIMISGFSTSLVANLLPGCHNWPPTVCIRTPLPLLVRQNAGENKNLPPAVHPSTVVDPSSSPLDRDCGKSATSGGHILSSLFLLYLTRLQYVHNEIRRLRANRQRTYFRTFATLHPKANV